MFGVSPSTAIIVSTRSRARSISRASKKHFKANSRRSRRIGDGSASAFGCASKSLFASNIAVGKRQNARAGLSQASDAADGATECWVVRSNTSTASFVILPVRLAVALPSTTTEDPLPDSECRTASRSTASRW